MEEKALAKTIKNKNKKQKEHNIMIFLNIILYTLAIAANTIYQNTIVQMDKLSKSVGASFTITFAEKGFYLKDIDDMVFKVFSNEVGKMLIAAFIINMAYFTYDSVKKQNGEFLEPKPDKFSGVSIKKQLISINSIVFLYTAYISHSHRTNMDFYHSIGRTLNDKYELSIVKYGLIIKTIGTGRINRILDVANIVMIIGLVINFLVIIALLKGLNEKSLKTRIQERKHK